MTSERKILRKIYGPEYEQRLQTIRSNLEVQNAYKSADIVTEIKVRRLEWLKHVIRMEDTGIPEMLLSSKPEGRRGVGRPKLRWLGDAEAVMKTVDVK